MLERTDFLAQKIVLIMANEGEKLSFKNDNLVDLDKNNKIKVQYSCYKIFIVYIIGGVSITSGIIQRSKKFGFSVILSSTSFKVYETINFKMEGNTILRMKQYTSNNNVHISKQIIINKINKQIDTIKLLRDTKNNNYIKLMSGYVDKLIYNQLNDLEIMGIEGAAAKIYFPIIFNNIEWKRREPRVKADIINLLLDTGYTVLFNYIESILNIYGFDIYKGNLHKEFYKRKSLVCDIIEPFRVIIDYQIRKMYNLGQVNDEDFLLLKGKYMYADWKKSSKYIGNFLEIINKNREEIFMFIQSYYRWVMKEKSVEEFPKVGVLK